MDNTPWTYRFSLGDNTLECRLDIFYEKYGKDVEAIYARFVEAELFIKDYQLMEFVIPDNLALINEKTGDAINVIEEIEKQAMKNFHEELDLDHGNL
jgi:hypothetical protein